MGIYMWTGTPTPVGADLVYDFSVSDGGWTPKNSSTQWNTNGVGGWTQAGYWSDGYIQAPSEIFAHNPTKIAISIYKSGNGGVGWDLGTGIMVYDASTNQVHCRRPGDYNSLEGIASFGGGSNMNSWSLGANPDGDLVWTLEVNNSSLPRVVTHTVTNCPNTITDDVGWLATVWANQQLRIRIVNWSAGGIGAIVIKKVEIWF